MLSRIFGGSTKTDQRIIDLEAAIKASESRVKALEGRPGLLTGIVRRIGEVFVEAVTGTEPKASEQPKEVARAAELGKQAGKAVAGVIKRTLPQLPSRL